MIDARFYLIDPLNPGCGFQVVIENSTTGDELLNVGRSPDTGDDLLTERQCLRVIEMYLKAEN